MVVAQSGTTVTNVFNIASGNRNYINAKVNANSGTFTNKIVDAGTDSDYTIRG